MTKIFFSSLLFIFIFVAFSIILPCKLQCILIFCLSSFFFHISLSFLFLLSYFPPQMALPNTPPPLVGIGEGCIFQYTVYALGVKIRFRVCCILFNERFNFRVCCIVTSTQIPFLSLLSVKRHLFFKFAACFLLRPGFLSLL
jgi:hypothetical protein